MDTTTTAAPAATLGPLNDRTIMDAIRGAYDLGYNDARNVRTVPGDSAPGYKGRDVEADHGGALIHTLSRRLAAPAAQEAAGTVYVEARECGACGHVGINDAPDTSACTHCEWHGPSPTEDLCPGCGQKGAMTTACPECGHRTTCLAIAHLPVTRSDAAAQEAEPARVVAHRMLRRNSFGEWVDEGRYWVDGPAPDELVHECLKFRDTFRIQNAYSEPEPRPQSDDPAAAMREAVARAEAVIAAGGEAQRLQQSPEPAAPTQEAVAYLDIGAGGYVDVGTDLAEEQLAALPKGRHMLAIIGTYGIAGYTPAQVDTAIDAARARQEGGGAA